MLTDHIGLRATDDALRLIIGEGIATGEFRKVYHCPLDSTVVVKIEYKPDCFVNVAEWDMWTNLKNTPWGKWLAPCRQISNCGLILMMDKVKPLEARPRLVPSFLGDLKRENWGMLNGRPVVCDYGNSHIYNHVAKHTRMVKPKWHDL